MNGEAVAAALGQARLDLLGYDHFSARLIATEAERALVAVFFSREHDKLTPSPVRLYAVSLDGATAWQVDYQEGWPHGFHAERRK